MVIKLDENDQIELQPSPCLWFRKTHICNSYGWVLLSCGALIYSLLIPPKKQKHYSGANPCFAIGAQIPHPLTYIYFFNKWEDLFSNSSPVGSLTLLGPNQTLFPNHAGQSNFIDVINKRYPRNAKRHRNNFLPNLFLAPAGGSNPKGPYINNNKVHNLILKK